MKNIYLLLILILFSCKEQEIELSHAVSIRNCYGCQLFDVNDVYLGRSEKGEVMRFKEDLSKSKDLYLIPSLTENNAVIITVHVNEKIILDDTVSLKRNQYIIIKLNSIHSKIYNYPKQQSL